jgi:hypothetical protein
MIINMCSSIALAELVRFHIFLQRRGISTLDYLREQDKVAKESKIKI